MNLTCALSPCPNDIFLVCAYLNGLVGADLPSLPHFADIQKLNAAAIEGRYQWTKLSIHALGFATDYRLLPVGAALGEGVGPKLIAKRPFALDELSKKRVAIPGADTTAYLLFSLFAPKPAHTHFCLYHEIEELIANDVVDCGLIIHETRFSFEEKGLIEIVDFGDLWEERFKLPLPLGGLAVHRSIPDAVAQHLTSILTDSLAFAKSHPALTESFVLKHAQDKRWEIAHAHIALYVNRETEKLSLRGKEAIEKLLNEASRLGYYPPRKDLFACA